MYFILKVFKFVSGVVKIVTLKKANGLFTRIDSRNHFV